MGRSAPGGETNRPSVRQVDFPRTPECGELAERARRLGNEAYPKILALLADDRAAMPQQFNIVITRQLAQNHRRAAMRRARNWTKGVIPVGVTYEVSAATLGRTIQLDADTFVRNPDALDATLVHEMTHVAQHCLLPPSAPHWYEGIAAYVPYKLGYTNGSSCPRCSDVFPHYTYGYACAAAFLLFVEENYGLNVVRQLNSEVRRGSYADAFFARTTGASLDELWARFQQTPAFTPEAAGLLKLRDALGYVGGRPPKDLKARVVAYLKEQPEGVSTLDAIHFLDGLAKRNQLPGLRQGARMEWRVPIATPGRAGVEDYPPSRTLKGNMKGDSLDYLYVVVRHPQEGAWKLERAWRTSRDGGFAEEYAVP